jgi:hypothetical protein
MRLLMRTLPTAVFGAATGSGAAMKNIMKDMRVSADMLPRDAAAGVALAATRATAAADPAADIGGKV